MLKGIKFKDELLEQVKEMEAETIQQQFHADFLIMTGTFDGLIKDLLGSFVDERTKEMDTDNVVSMKKNTVSKRVPA